VADHFISDTVTYADIVLPSAMDDMVLSWGHLYLTYNEQCIDAPGDAISNREIFRCLVARMGYDDENLKWSDSECLENLVD
jgi:anaerobic selenocysteine-containing dehydrogenase